MLEVPRGFRADVLISWGDIFLGGDRRALRYGFNNDFLAHFPLRGSLEGLLFVNHEYTSWWPEGNKTAGDNPSTPMPSTVAITRAGRERGATTATTTERHPILIAAIRI